MAGAFFCWLSFSRLYLAMGDGWMRNRLFIICCCISILGLNSIVFADDSGSKASARDSLRVALVDDGQNANLRKWLEEIKPEAGGEAVESPRKLKYWQQKVVRRNRRTTSK